MDNDGKVNLLNSYFEEQTVLDDHLASLPESVDRAGPTLNAIVFSRPENKEILNNLKLGKASGPDNINNRILKEAALPLSKPLCDILITLCLKELVLIFGKRRIFHLYIRRMTNLL